MQTLENSVSSDYRYDLNYIIAVLKQLRETDIAYKAKVYDLLFDIFSAPDKEQENEVYKEQKNEVYEFFSGAALLRGEQTEQDINGVTSTEIYKANNRFLKFQVLECLNCMRAKSSKNDAEFKARIDAVTDISLDKKDFRSTVILKLGWCGNP